MGTNIRNRHRFLKTLLIWTAIASFLLWALYRLLLQAKLGRPVECFFMAQVCVVLLIAPYLAAYAMRTSFLNGHADSLCLIRLSPIPYGGYLLRLLLVSQVPLLCWVFLCTVIAFFVTRTPFIKVLQLLTVLSVCSVSAAAVGIWGAQVFKDALFGTECAYLLWCLLIGGAFLLVPLDRHVDSIQAMIPPVLHLNPLIAVCYIFEMDLFRTPFIYERVPIGSSDYANAPWHLVGLWQLLIGVCGFLGAWRISGTYRRVL